MPDPRPEQVRRFFARAGQLDRHSPVPLYYQLQELLKEDIDAGHWQPGAILPSEAELEAAFGVSRTVIRKALDVLEADGQVVRQKGRGTVVAPPKLLYDAVAAAQEWRSGDLSRRPVLARVVDVRVVVAGGNLGTLLGVPPDARLFEITAVAAVDSPVSLTQAYVPTGASPQLAAAAEAPAALPLEIGGPELLHQLATRCGLPLQRSDLSIETTTANEFECATLGVRGGATMALVSTVLRGPDDAPLGFLRSVVRSDHFRFAVSVLHEAGTPAAHGASRPQAPPT
ncbi:GntR family transcriptional regulator [Geodermatophilus sp. TF02-6]|uniref:GntR family transcriptional regulator n=1 Tax=Geodermatophilus sp. TF02-6 TaxID=2250575 RepID=UPI0011BE5B88|nr:GntR family transcriptional regulator [Geodermatophilus sp. TF02-6]